MATQRASNSVPRHTTHTTHTHTFLATFHTTPQGFGFLVEYIATPKALVDTTPHYRPVGAYEFALWRKGLPLPTPIERYRNDPGALKLISQDQWTLDRPLYDIKATNTIVGAESDYFVQAQRRQNFFRRMVPHIFGWFTMSAAWIIIIVRPCTSQTYSHTNPHTPQESKDVRHAHRSTSSGRGTTSPSCPT